MSLLSCAGAASEAEVLPSSAYWLMMSSTFSMIV